MSTRSFFIVLLILAGLIIFGVSKQSSSTVAVNDTDNQMQNLPNVTGESSSSPLSQTNEMGAVTVEITPTQIVPDEPIILEIVLNTHSVDLDFDFTKIATLTDDQGKIYQANEWTGESGGHHLVGNLIFEPLSGDSKTITLNVVEIDDATSNFTWDL